MELFYKTTLLYIRVTTKREEEEGAKKQECNVYFEFSNINNITFNLKLLIKFTSPPLHYILLR